MIRASCPACGAPIEMKNKASVWAVCEHCKTLAVRTDLNLSAMGKVADLAADGSVVQLGTKGRYKGKGFEVVGRIQLQYDQGYWNEWYLDFGGSSAGWLGEALGEYMVSFQAAAPPEVPAFEAMAPGASIGVERMMLEATDKREARCISGQGELPFQVRSGYTAKLVDLVGPSGRFGTIDYSEDPPIVFLGEYVDFEQLELTDLREIEGW